MARSFVLSLTAILLATVACGTGAPPPAHSTSHTSSTGGGDTEDTDALCADGIDNDGDGYIDCDDYNCSRNSAVTVCGSGGGSTGGSEDTNALCADGQDNDGDGHIDCDDYNCSRNASVTVCG